MSRKISLLVWVTWLATAVVSTALIGLAPTLDRKSVATDKPFVWAAVGGIRASGASYGMGGSTDYDDNKNNCLRSRQAYSVHLSENASWVPDGRPQDFRFEACSSHAQVSTQLNPDNIPASPDMLLLEISALGTTLSAIADACILAPDGKDWGPAYPDSNGQCHLELEKARAYAGTSKSSKLLEDVQATVNSVFESDRVKANADFRLFIPGYLQFFYEDGGEGDWCNETSFSLRKENRPVLSLNLRAEINSIVREVNNAVESALATSNHPDRAHFVDIDTQIAGQGFCQPGHTLYDQYYSEKVLFWNLAPEGVILRSESTDSGNKVGAYEVRGPTPDEFDRWLKTGVFTNDAREVRTNMTVVTGVGMAFAEGHGVDDNTQWLNQMGPYRNLPGLALRAFQPRAVANKAIANVISKEVRHQYTNKPFGAGHQANQNAFDNGSIQIALREYNGYFSWFMYHGPYGFAVNPCGDNKFKLVLQNVRDGRQGLSLKHPPYVDSGRIWQVDIPGWSDCRFVSAKDGPGALKCSDALIYDFGPEAHPRGIIRCHRKDAGAFPEGSYNRAWVVEY